MLTGVSVSVSLSRAHATRLQVQPSGRRATTGRDLQVQRTVHGIYSSIHPCTYMRCATCSMTLYYKDGMRQACVLQRWHETSMCTETPVGVPRISEIALRSFPSWRRLFYLLGGGHDTSPEVEALALVRRKAL